jgi:hypothetical protein
LMVIKSSGWISVQSELRTGWCDNQVERGCEQKSLTANN